MSTIKSFKETTTTIDETGKELTTVKESTTKYEKCSEPDYIKLYTKVWCEFNEIPNQWRPLFFELIARMTYADSTDLEHSQIVATGGMTREAICKALGWKPNMYQKGLKALKDAGAIKQKMKGFYQINPNYAGRGEWKYNPRLARGGVEDLKATFDFKNHTVDIDVIWADDGEDTDFNQMYRDGLGVSKKNGTVLKTVKATPVTEETNIPGQLDLNFEEA